MQQPGRQKKILKQALRNHDPEAARLLLAHSMAFGHERLAVSRYLAAHYLGSEDLEEFRPYCRNAVRRFKPQVLLTLATKIARELHLDVDVHCALSELVVAEKPLNLSYLGVLPSLGRGPRYCGMRVSLAGRVEIASNPWFGPGAVVRGDGHFVRIGDDFRIGRHSTVHIAHELFPALIGSRVTAGHNVVIHACTVSDDCVIEDGVIILDGSLIESGVLIEAGSTVYPRSTLKAGWVYSGSPAKPVREIGLEERGERRRAISEAIFSSVFNASPGSFSEAPSLGEHVFVASSANLRGKIEIGDATGVFFGCDLNGSGGGIQIGPNCNIQDNTVIDAARGPVVIGANVTVGHNVDMAACVVGEASLIGIGCKLAEGTVVDRDVLLAAGSTTKPGQHLEKGWLWGGRPARQIAPLDDAKRAMLSASVEQYRTYSAQFNIAQQLRSLEEV